MKFLRSLFAGKGRAPEAAAPAPAKTPEQVDALAAVRRAAQETGSSAPLASPKADITATPLDKSTSDILRAVAERAKEPGAPAGPGIWDMDDSLPSAEELLARAKDAPPKGKRRRVKTRLVGFDTSDGEVVDLFQKSVAEALGEDAPEPEAEPESNGVAATIPMFPVGWMLVIEGPGRGASYPLHAGMSQVGRGSDQAVRLDFGDSAISRTGHAAIVYDPEAKTFLLGQGGKSNIVRLNGTPVIQNEPLKDGDHIKVGETVLQLKTLCGDDFDWSNDDDTGEEDEDDVAIA